mmetsp:Transcript_5090/g.7708  ORF Transcript_5090/g.7708 Transcript_5090/m.7708 type:complete len:267 (+) Transcript_5090:975-1775(+)
MTTFWSGSLSLCTSSLSTPSFAFLPLSAISVKNSSAPICTQLLPSIPTIRSPLWSLLRSIFFAQASRLAALAAAFSRACSSSSALRWASLRVRASAAFLLRCSTFLLASAFRLTSALRWTMSACSLARASALALREALSVSSFLARFFSSAWRFRAAAHRPTFSFSRLSFFSSSAWSFLMAFVSSSFSLALAFPIVLSSAFTICFLSLPFRLWSAAFFVKTSPAAILASISFLRSSSMYRRLINIPLLSLSLPYLILRYLHVGSVP